MRYSEIVNGLKKNDFRLQMEFYDLFADATYRSAFAVLSNSAEAEEIMQDAMLKVFTRTSLIADDETQMLKILRRMAINAAIDVLRKRKRALVFDDNAIADIDRIDEDGDETPSFTVDDVKREMAALADGYRTILSLHLFAEMSFDEIADRLRIAASSVRSQYSRALAKLRKQLLNDKKE